METRDLVAILPGVTVRGTLPEAVTGLSFDSRTVGPGEIFVCRRGTTADSHAFARAAVERGAAVIVAEREPDPPAGAPLLLVPDAREALARLAAAVHGFPSANLRLVGVTGTNGKTTTTHFLTAVARAAGERTGRIGTIGYDIAGRTIDAPHTTPEATVLNGLLSEMLEDDVTFAAMEVSSHALDQRRSFGLHFAAVLFTNLTQDHLDYHAGFEAYYEAKRRLFRRAERGSAGRTAAVINSDDAHGRRLAGEADGPVVTFGVESPADYRAAIESLDVDGTSITITGPQDFRRPVRLRMVGPFNVMNALGAAATMRELGYADPALVEGLESLTGVPGRMERVDRGQPFAVIVDYAHTPDALERVLRAARAATRHRVLSVFGCGGDRDRTKRPIMGRLSTSLADQTWVTSDNPRTEEPPAIVEEILVGAREGGRPWTAEVDRRHAIEAAIRAAVPGDVVVIAGKGHEPYQILKDRTIHFDDREEAARVLGELGFDGGRHGR